MYYKMRVETIPVPKGRPKFYRGHAVTPARTREYESLLRQNWQHGVLSGKLIVKMEFVMPIPKSLSKRKRESMIGTGCCKRPDLDNLVKSALDSLNNGVAFEDDSSIWKLIATKEYGEVPSVQITIWNHGG